MGGISNFPSTEMSFTIYAMDESMKESSLNDYLVRSKASATAQVNETAE
jgi:hypothetical protein